MMPVAYSRREFLTRAGIGCTALAMARRAGAVASGTAEAQAEKPNIIFCMTDDQGWGDVGYNGHPHLKTPNLDAMARSGLRFDRFYASAPVCSPTRGSCLTGRHPYRYGIFHANVGHMPPQEVTLAEALKAQGYATGHFGKWHLGTLTKTRQDSNRGGPRGVRHYSPPWENGFDVCFSTEAKVPTWDPMKEPGTDKTYGTHYWREDGTAETAGLDGDDSRIIMDRVIPFVRQAAAAGAPFFAVVWFHAPHRPVVAGPRYLAMYEGLPDLERHFYGCITAMDEQVGRLRNELKRLNIAQNTMLWFCSDNGPEGQAGDAPGSAGPFRGRKRDLFEGGIRVPGLLEWPAKIASGRTADMPCATLDYFPTVMEAVGVRIKGQPQPLDGISLLPMIEGRLTERPAPIAFESKNQIAIEDKRYKIISRDHGKTYMLFDVIEDPGESRDLAAEKPEIVKAMRVILDAWRASCKDSRAGKDYARQGP